MKFTYTAISKDGKTVTGTSDAANKEALNSSLMRQGLRPVIVKIAGGQGRLLGRSKRNKKVKLKDLVIFTRQLSTMISAGVPLTRALNMMQSQAGSKHFAAIIGSITKDVEAGLPMGEALAKFPGAFSDVYINMVKAGEAGGILDEILKRLASQVEQDSSMRKKIKSAMTYPIVILSVTVIAFLEL